MSNAMPFSPEYGIHLVENFLTNDSSTDAAIGSLLWEAVTIGNASTIAYLSGTTAVAPGGGLRLTTAATADGDGEALRLDEDICVFGSQGGLVRARVRYPDITGNQLAGNNFRIGIDDSVTATAPTVGIWIDSNAGVLSLEADSADHGDRSAAVSGVPTDVLTSGTTMILGTWYDLSVVWSGANDQGGPDQAVLYVNGHEGAKITDVQIDDDEEAEPKIVHWQDTGGAASLELDIAYVEFLLWR